MTGQDAGTTFSEIRIDLNALSGDINKVEQLYEGMDKKTSQGLTKTEKAVKNITNVTKQGAMSQVEALKRVTLIREQQLAGLQTEVAKKGSATAKELAQIKKLEQELKRLTAVKNQNTIATKKGTTATNQSNKSMGKMAVEYAAIATSILAIKGSLRVFTTTEQALANVKAVTNATAEEFNLMKDSALEAGANTRATASDSANALYHLASAGLTAKESTESLNATIILSGATQTDLSQAAKTLTSTMSQYNIETKNSSDITNILAAACSNSQATMEKLTGSLRQVGSVAGLMGISLEETVGALQLLYNKGYQGENAGRALKSALADMGNESSQTVKKLNALGIGFDEINPQVVGLTGAIDVLNRHNIDAAQSLNIFGKVAGGQMASLIAAGATEIDKLTAAVTGTTEAQKQYEIQNDTLAGDWDKLKSAGQNLAILITEELSPALRSLVSSATFLINGFAQIPALFKGSAGAAGVAGVAMLALSKTMGIALGPIGWVVTGVASITGAFISLNKQLKEKNFERLSEEFGELAKAAGYSGEALEEFLNEAEQVSDAMALLDDMSMFDSMKKDTYDMAMTLGLTHEEILNIGIASKDLSKEYKTQLENLRDQLLESKMIREEKRLQQSLLKAGARAEFESSRNRLKNEQEANILLVENVNNKLRLKEIQEQAILLDEIHAKGGMDESELMEEKISLRQEEIGILKAQMLANGKTSKASIDSIKAQERQIKVYQARLKELEKTKKDNGDEEKKRDEANLLRDQTKAKLDETYLTKLKKLSWSRIALLEEEKKLVLEQARISGANIYAIELYYEKMKTKLIEEEEKNKQDARKKSFDDQVSDLTAIQGHIETGLAVVSALATGNLDDIYSSVSASLSAIGTATGNIYLIGAGMAMDLSKQLFGVFDRTDEIEEMENRIVGIRKNTLELLRQMDNDFLEKTYDDKEKALEDFNKKTILGIVSNLSQEEKLNLQTLGVITRSKEEAKQKEINDSLKSYLDLKMKEKEIDYSMLENDSQKRIENQQLIFDEERKLFDKSFNAQIEAQEKLYDNAKDNADKLLEDDLKAIDEKFNADQDRLTKLSKAEQDLEDFKNGLKKEASDKENKETEDEINRLRSLGFFAEAEELQQKLNNSLQLEALEIAADEAKAQRLENLEAIKNQKRLDIEAAKKVRDDRDIELDKLKLKTETAIETIQDSRQKAETAHETKVSEFKEKEAKNLQTLKDALYDSEMENLKIKYSSEMDYIKQIYEARFEAEKEINKLADERKLAEDIAEYENKVEDRAERIQEYEDAIAAIKADAKFYEQWFGYERQDEMDAIKEEMETFIKASKLVDPRLKAGANLNYNLPEGFDSPFLNKSSYQSTTPVENNLTVTFELDSVELARTVAKPINDGQVKVTI